MKKVLSVRSNRIYLYAVMLYMVLCVLIYWDHRLDIMNTTVYAFSYKYGFMPRGVLGSFLLLYDSVVPFDAISYNTIYFISEIATAILFVMLLWFIIAVFSRVSDRQLVAAKGLMAPFILISIPFFVTVDMFGRLDVFLIILTLLCLILIIYEKAEWLIIPAVTLAGLIHEGFVFMNLNIILVLLLYKCIFKKERRRYYIVILALTFILPSVIFLYCEFFSHNFDEAVYNECFALAEKVSLDNIPHREVLLHEILGADVAGLEVIYRIWNFEDSVIFLPLFSPYIVLMVAVFRRYAKSAKNATDKFITFIVLAGPLTLVPELILKCDYGRYVYAILFYYLAIFLVLLALRDKRVEETVSVWKGIVLRHKVLSLLGIAYLFVFIPFKGYRICDIVTFITEQIWGTMT